MFCRANIHDSYKVFKYVFRYDFFCFVTYIYVLRSCIATDIGPSNKVLRLPLFLRRDVAYKTIFPRSYNYKTDIITNWVQKTSFVGHKIRSADVMKRTRSITAIDHGINVIDTVCLARVRL